MTDTTQPDSPTHPHLRRWIVPAAIKLIIIVGVTVWAIYTYL